MIKGSRKHGPFDLRFDFQDRAAISASAHVVDSSVTSSLMANTTTRRGS
jgi:hypothetical protein